MRPTGERTSVGRGLNVLTCHVNDWPGDGWGKLRLRDHPAPPEKIEDEDDDDWPEVLGSAPWFLTRKAALKS